MWGLTIRCLSQQTIDTSIIYSGNPIIKHNFTADPPVLVYKDMFYIYTGHDEQNEGGKPFLMKDWHVFSSYGKKRIKSLNIAKC